MEEIAAYDAYDKVHIGTDYFDASINRIAATAIGARAAIAVAACNSSSDGGTEKAGKRRKYNKTPSTLGRDKNASGRDCMRILLSGTGRSRNRVDSQVNDEIDKYE